MGAIFFSELHAVETVETKPDPRGTDRGFGVVANYRGRDDDLASLAARGGGVGGVLAAEVARTLGTQRVTGDDLTVRINRHGLGTSRALFNASGLAAADGVSVRHGRDLSGEEGVTGEANEELEEIGVSGENLEGLVCCLVHDLV